MHSPQCLPCNFLIILQIPLLCTIVLQHVCISVRVYLHKFILYIVPWYQQDNQKCFFLKYNTRRDVCLSVFSREKHYLRAKKKRTYIHIHLVQSCLARYRASQVGMQVGRQSLRPSGKFATGGCAATDGLVCTRKGRVCLRLLVYIYPTFVSFHDTHFIFPSSFSSSPPMTHMVRIHVRTDIVRVYTRGII